MKTSAQWWEEVKNDPARFNEWLLKQYRGETTAAQRILEVAKGAENPQQVNILFIIANQEAQHAVWVENLLKARGISVRGLDHADAEKRYWATVKKSIKDFTSAMAVAAHAEAMRLERINVIATDPEAPEDVREVFKLILIDELFHERAFRELAGADAMAEVKPNADEGRRLLGLVA